MQAMPEVVDDGSRTSSTSSTGYRPKSSDHRLRGGLPALPTPGGTTSGKYVATF